MCIRDRERVELLNGKVNYQGMIGFTIIAKIPIRNKLTGKKDRDELNNQMCIRDRCTGIREA